MVYTYNELLFSSKKQQQQKNYWWTHPPILVNIKIIMLVEKLRQKRVHTVWLHLREILKKMQSNLWWWKQISGCLRMERVAEEGIRITRLKRKLVRVMDMLLSWMWWWFHRNVNIKLYTSNMCSWLCVNYASIKL